MQLDKEENEQGEKQQESMLKRGVLNIGVLGAAWIVPDALINPAPLVDGVKILAIASRDERRGVYTNTHKSKCNLFALLLFSLLCSSSIRQEAQHSTSPQDL